MNVKESHALVLVHTIARRRLAFLRELCRCVTMV